LVEELHESGSLFGERKNERNEIVLSYCKKNTKVSISGNELAVFRRLLKKVGETMSFDELSEAIRNRSNLLRPLAPLRQTREATETEKGAVRSAIDEVRKKLKSATGYVNFTEIIASDRGKGYKMIT